MKKNFVFSFMALYAVATMECQTDLIKLRDLYYKAPSGKDEARELIDFLSSRTSVKPCIISGYKAAAFMIQARHSWNPYDKLSLFNLGKRQLDETINNSPFELELRFLRLGIQQNAPDFLGYNDNIKSDERSLLDQYSRSSDLDLKNRIEKYLKETGALSENEKPVSK